MNSPIKLYKAVLKTGNKTPKDIRKILEAPTDNEINRWIAAYNLIDGLKVLVMESAFSKETYTIAAYNQDDDERFKEFHYQMEQETNDWFGPYSENREAFMEDWKNGEYEASGSFVFGKDEIEIIEKCEKKSSL